MMNAEQLGATVRAVVIAVGGAIVAQGYLTEDQLVEIAGSIAIIVGFGWSLYIKRGKK